MEATHQEIMIHQTENIHSVEEQLSELFGSFKAEWLKDDVFDLFTQPAYFPELITHRPCVLVGGRGTGKTTVLRGLSYEGQFVLTGRKKEEVKLFPYYGIYYKVDTNHVTSFRGGNMSDEDWKPYFAHYINLLLCNLTVRFLEWYEDVTSSVIHIDQKSYHKFAVSLNIEPVSTVDALKESIELTLIKFAANLNSVIDGARPALSMPKAPVDILINSILSLPEFKGKNFFFLIDEYENLYPYQQHVVNTYIKHPEGYTFKIGVKELGLQRETLQKNQPLSSPADYNLIDISRELTGERFKEFALSVCNQRISKIKILGQEPITDIRPFLPGLTEEDEANLLGVRKAVASVESVLRTHPNPAFAEVLDTLKPLQIYFINYWAESQSSTVEAEFADFIQNRESWDVRYRSYKHAILYTIRSGKPGTRKYYCGWDVLTQLSAGNIRYLMELVDKSFLEHYKQSGNLSEPIPPKIQTEVAKSVGEKYLQQVPTLSEDGAQLMRMLLGLGRIFGIMAADAKGHAAEVNQFYVGDGKDEELEQLLKSAVMHLVLLSPSGTKLQSDQNTRDHDYMVHPVFSAFFEFSYRRKRKIILSRAEILGLAREPKDVIPGILKRTNRINEENMPEQLRLFERTLYGTAE